MNGLTPPTNDKVFSAVVSAQGEMPAIPFDSSNPFLKNRYASLGSVIATSRPILAKHKLAVIQRVETHNGDLTVHTSIIHESGQSIDGGVLSLPIGEEKGKSRAQVAGSICTYLKRYAWASILGLYADEDDDGNTPPPARPVPAPAKERFGTMRQATEYLPEPPESDWDSAKPKTPVQTPPTPEKPVLSQPEPIVKDSKEKLWFVLEQLACREGEPNRQLVTDYLRALKWIGPEQEPENWPVKWLPYKKPSHLRDLGGALANFKNGQPAVMPYPPNEPLTHVKEWEKKTGNLGVAVMKGPKTWKSFIFPYGKSDLRGHALGELPEDVLVELWRTFEVHKLKDAATNTMVESQTDRALRNALDEMGSELGYRKEE